MGAQGKDQKGMEEINGLRTRYWGGSNKSLSGMAGV